MPDSLTAAPLHQAIWDALEPMREYVTREEVDRWIAEGWTVDTASRLLGLARSWPPPNRLLFRFVDVLARWESLVQPHPRGHALSHDEAMPWLELYVAAPNTGARLTLEFLYCNGDGETRRDFQAWYSLGPLAPLAWAAGLSFEEARHASAMGDLNEQVLRSLAALQGWLLPSLSC